MTKSLQARIRARKVDLRGLDSIEVQKRANAIFRRICATAAEYERTGEPAADVVEAAIYKHHLSLAGLQGSIAATVPGGLSADRATADRAHEEAIQVYLKYKADITAYLKQQIIELRAESTRDASD